MGISFRYWDDCVDHLDMEALWMIPDVSTEWTNAGETRGQKVHLSRDPDGQKYLTQNEMRVKPNLVPFAFRLLINGDIV